MGYLACANSEYGCTVHGTKAYYCYLEPRLCPSDRFGFAGG